jgi:LCP family protein required for cell wall assembly
MPAIRAKINSAYYWGNQKENTSGFDNGVASGGVVLAKASVEEVVGVPIHYAAVLDFDGFTEIIDVVGGIEANVKEGFVDEKFPIEGKEDDECGGDSEFKCRYETVKFRQGLQVMDGETALKFVRSRNAEGEEGTDFAREQRQQLVISSLKRELLSKKMITSPKKLLSIKNVLEKYTETDITESEMAVLARYVYDARQNIKSEVLPEEFLENPEISPKYDNLYVLIPRDDDPETPEHDWSRVHEWINESLD